METRVEKTIERHNKGYNCAQAVACTYCDLVGMDEESMFKATEALGLGMGGMEGTCGALTGACVIAGMKNSCGNLDNPISKGETYQYSRQILKKFLDQNKATRCKDLKGVETGVVLRGCQDCIRDAVRYIELCYSLFIHNRYDAEIVTEHILLVKILTSCVIRECYYH